MAPASGVGTESVCVLHALRRCTLTVSNVSFLLGALREAAGAVVDESALVDLEELQLSLIDVLAVAVTGSEVCSGEAMVRTVPAVLASSACSCVVPVECHFGTGWSVGRVR